MRERGRSTRQVFTVVTAILCDLFTIVESAFQELRALWGEAQTKVGNFSEVSSSLVAGSDVFCIEEVYDGDLNDKEGDLNYVIFTSKGVVSLRAREVRAGFTKVYEERRTAGLQAPNTILDFLSKLAEMHIATATCSTSTSSFGASELSSQNELLWASPSGTQCLLQARWSSLSRDLQETSAWCAELKRSLDLFKPLFQKLERDLAK